MSAPRSPVPATLSAALWHAAEEGCTADVLQLLAEECCAIDARSIYQSTLLHAAAKHGHLQLARELLARGADVNALDYGGMRRTPLHWACRGGHVAMVELLVAAGATKAYGRSWFKLVQGSRCGSLIPKDGSIESVESLCTTHAVRLALTQPRWEPCIHSQWPKRFRDAARLLLLAAYCPQNGSRDASDAGSATADCSTTSGSSSGSGRGGSATAGGPVLPLDSDALLEVLQRAAFPISAWLP